MKTKHKIVFNIDTLDEAKSTEVAYNELISETTTKLIEDKTYTLSQLLNTYPQVVLESKKVYDKELLDECAYVVKKNEDKPLIDTELKRDFVLALFIDEYKNNIDEDKMLDTFNKFAAAGFPSFIMFIEELRAKLDELVLEVA